MAGIMLFFTDVCSSLALPEWRTHSQTVNPNGKLRPKKYFVKNCIIIDCVLAQRVAVSQMVPVIQAIRNVAYNLPRLNL
jgi:hypothetical protein